MCGPSAFATPIGSLRHAAMNIRYLGFAGLFCGIEIVKNRKTREPIHEAVMEPPRPATSKMTFLGKCMQEGVYIMAGGASVIMLSPPLNISREDLDFAMDVIDRNLAICDADCQK